MSLPFYTIGHSTRSLDAFGALLQRAEVRLLVDIRTVRRSRHNPQYNEDSLPAALGTLGIAYRALPALGGLRAASKTVAADVNGYWQNTSFHHYADYALGPEFAQGLHQLIALGREQRCAIMCAEAVWWRCHRRIVADYLIAHGETVNHLMGTDRIDRASLTPGALILDGPIVHYPPTGAS